MAHLFILKSQPEGQVSNLTHTSRNLLEPLRWRLVPSLNAPFAVLQFFKRQTFDRSGAPSFVTAAKGHLPLCPLALVAGGPYAHGSPRTVIKGESSSTATRFQGGNKPTSSLFP